MTSSGPKCAIYFLSHTIASENGENERSSGPKKLCGYTGLYRRVYRSGGTYRRGPPAKNGPTYLRWAFIEAAVHASRHSAYAAHCKAAKWRLGRKRGIEMPRMLAEAICYMLARLQAFAPEGPTPPLVVWTTLD